MIDAKGKVASALKSAASLPKAEREFRLCRSLRSTLREMQSFSGQLRAVVYVKEINALLTMIGATTAVESEVAEFFSVRFRNLADAAHTSEVDATKLRRNVKAFKDTFLGERQRLIRNEIELYSIL